MPKEKIVYVNEFLGLKSIGCKDEVDHKSCFIWNAPRPLLGHLIWSGPFRHGIYYAAVQRSHPEAASMSMENMLLDGWPVEVISNEEIREKFYKYVEGYGLDLLRAMKASLMNESKAEAMKRLVAHLGWPYEPEADKTCKFCGAVGEAQLEFSIDADMTQRLHSYCPLCWNWKLEGKEFADKGAV